MSPGETERDRLLALLLSKVEKMEEAGRERDKQLSVIQGRVTWIGETALLVGFCVSVGYVGASIDPKITGLEHWLYFSGLVAVFALIYAGLLLSFEKTRS